MLERIREKLQALGCAGWELCEVTTRGWEFYFIRHRLDQNRAKQITNYTVRVFMTTEGGKFLGSAGDSISPTASDAEIDAILAKLVYEAQLVKNPYYTLPDAPVELPAKTAPVDVAQIAENFLRALRGVPETQTEDINSYEIFVDEITRRFRNSNGVSYDCVYPSSTAEVVVNARRDGHEIELYRFFTSGTCDAAKLQRDIESALRCGKDRLIAVPTPKSAAGLPVILSTDDALQVYEYFTDRMSAGFKVRKISDWEIGKPVCEVTDGDRVSVEALSSLANSSQDYPVDEEGSVIEDRFLIRGGIAENHWGSRQFSQYLGLEKSSIVHNFRFAGGEKTAEELRGGDYLELVEFSDFQIDSMGGDVAGEIRLGYLHKGGKTVAVTGGSLTGSLTDALPTMRFSKETVQYDTWVVPAVTRLENLKITGAADE